MVEKTNLKVSYKNELNLIPLRKFNSKEMDLFFALCAKMKGKEQDSIRFDFADLKELSDYKPTAVKRFADDLESLYDKMLHLTYRDEFEEEGLRRKFVLFTGFEISEKHSYVEVSVNPKLKHVLNNLENEFTKYELKSFTEIRSTYAKTLFRLLMQYQSTRFYTVKITEFRDLMDIPSYYKMGNIDQTVLKPALKELNNYFENLKVQKVKAKKGNKIDKLEFTFSGLKSDLPKVPLHDWTK